MWPKGPTHLDEPHGGAPPQDPRRLPSLSSSPPCGATGKAEVTPRTGVSRWRTVRAESAHARFGGADGKVLRVQRRSSLAAYPTTLLLM